MKKLQIKLLSFALFPLILGSAVTSAVTLYNIQNHKSLNSTVSNHSVMAGGNPKIEAILEMIDEDMLRGYLEPLIEYILVCTDTEYPFKWHFNKLSIREHRVTVVAYDKLGRRTSNWKDIRFINMFQTR